MRLNTPQLYQKPLPQEAKGGLLFHVLWPYPKPFSLLPRVQNDEGSREAWGLSMIPGCSGSGFHQPELRNSPEHRKTMCPSDPLLKGVKVQAVALRLCPHLPRPGPSVQGGSRKTTNWARPAWSPSSRDHPFRKAAGNSGQLPWTYPHPLCTSAPTSTLKPVGPTSPGASLILMSAQEAPDHTVAPLPVCLQVSTRPGYPYPRPNSATLSTMPLKFTAH